ncbi:MAG: DUF1176 domain-containing protein [Erythrobacter sp.]|uniref:DUF1176 domain-containing protein n=1 Tax=Erythrobacter sp. TaxID=1042 RepID=UPI0032636C74
MSFTAFLAASAAIAVDIPQPEQFGDWAISCDNGRYCAAQAAFEDSYDGKAWVISIGRDGKPQAAPSLYLSPAFYSPEASTRIKIDGRISRFGIDKNGSLIGDPVQFLDALAKAQKAEIIGEDGTVVGGLAVSGASAALRWMDDRQMRVGTVSAIVARGSKPASAVPPLPSLPKINTPEQSAAPPRIIDNAQIATIKAQANCSKAYHEDEFFRLDNAHTLGLIACGTGAYQGFSVAILIQENGAWSPAPIEQARPLWEGAKTWSAATITTAHYTPQSHLLNTFVKGRGLGDYGLSASWVWDGEIFRLANYSALDRGRGGPPGDWLPQWQTKNAPRFPAQ